MQSIYSKKNKTTQYASDNVASSVLDNSFQSESLQCKAEMVNNAAQRVEAPRPNNTGMPDNLKSGIESLSGFSMDDVRVHYNSSKPATVQALAYTQGTDIHVAPGQEKHLPHEAWHVAQQMAGRVSPTTNINGMPVNDNAALEHEADVMGEKAVQCKCEKNFADKRISSFSSRVSNMRQFVVQREPEENSVFAIEKIKNFLKDQFKLTDVSDSDAERVQTLFEDIRQVDLQFLAAMASAYGEDDSHFHGNVDDILAISKKETEKKDQSQSENGLLNRANVEDMLANSTELEQDDQKETEKEDYEIMVNGKIEYLEKQKKAVDERIGALLLQSLFDEGGNDAQKRYEVVIGAQIHYLEELEWQKELLNKALAQIEQTKQNEEMPEGTLFNQNVLLSSGDDGKFEAYMCIVGPGHDEFKDIIKGDDGKLTPSGTQLQIGIASPVRQFSWYLKYLIDEAAEVNNPPLIRTFKMSQDAFREWQKNAISEKKAQDPNNPMNEDFKTWNQFGIPSTSSLLGKIGFSGFPLTTVVDRSLVPDDHPLLDKSGTNQSLDDFKKKIGFGRWIDDKSVPKRNGEFVSKFVPSDVHLFDETHTAFFNIADKKAEFYTAKDLRNLYDEYGRLMLFMEDFFKSPPKDGETEDREYTKFKEKIKQLIILNNCAPSSDGSEKDSVNSERLKGVESLGVLDNTRLITIVIAELNQSSEEQQKALLHNSGIINEFYELVKEKLTKIDDLKCVLEICQNFKWGKMEKMHASALCFKILRVLEHNKGK